MSRTPGNSLRALAEIAAQETSQVPRSSGDSLRALAEVAASSSWDEPAPVNPAVAARLGSLMGQAIGMLPGNPEGGSALFGAGGTPAPAGVVRTAEARGMGTVDDLLRARTDGMTGAPMGPDAGLGLGGLGTLGPRGGPLPGGGLPLGPSDPEGGPAVGLVSAPNQAASGGMAGPADDESRFMDTVRSLALGAASGVPQAMAQLAALVRSGLYAASDPGQAAAHAGAGAIRMAADPATAFGAPPSAGYVPALARGAAGALDDASAGLPRRGLSPVDSAADAVLRLAQTTGRTASDAIAGAAPARARESFTPEAIAFGAGQSLPHLGVSAGGATVGGILGGPPGAVAGAFAPSLLIESAANVEETYQTLRERGVNEEDALTRSFIPAVSAAVPAAALDALTGGEAAVARSVLRSGIEQQARTLAKKVLAAGKTVGRATIEEALTEPVQGTLSDVGLEAAAPGSIDAATIPERRGMEAAVGGVLGAAGGAAAVTPNFVPEGRRRPAPVQTQGPAEPVGNPPADRTGVLAPPAERAPAGPPVQPPDPSIGTGSTETPAEPPPPGWPARQPARAVAGREGRLKLADGNDRTVRYAVVEAEDVITTHRPLEGFAPDQMGDLNERPYQDPTEGKASRDTVQRIAESLDPDLLLTNTPTPTDGPPVTTGDYRTLGGNARAMGLKIAYARRPERAAAYRRALVERAAEFGIDPGAVATMRAPVLVRAIQGDVGKRGELSRVLNESLTTGKTSDTDAISRGLLLDQADTDRIAAIVGDTTVREALSDPRRSADIIRVLVDAGAFSPSDLVELRRADGALEDVGKAAIEKTLLGAAIGDVRALAQTAPGVRQKLVAALPSLTRLRRGKMADLRFQQVLANSLDALQAFRESGARSIEDLVTQTSMLPDPWRQDDRALALAESMLNDGPRVFAGKLAEVARIAEESAGGQAGFEFGQPRSAGEAFDAVFESSAEAGRAGAAGSPDVPGQSGLFGQGRTDSGIGRQQTLAMGTGKGALRVERERIGRYHVVDASGAKVGAPHTTKAQAEAWIAQRSEQAEAERRARRPDETDQEYRLRLRWTKPEVVAATGSLFGQTDATEPADAGRGGVAGSPARAGSPSAAPSNTMNQQRTMAGDVKSSMDPERIVKRLAEVAGTPFRVGHGWFAQTKSMGWFSRQNESVRLKVANRLSTAAHEFGHAIHHKVLGWDMRYPPAVKRELAAMGRELYGDRKPNAGYPREGVAEYFARYFLGDDVAAKAPHTHAWFQETLLPQHPRLQAGIAELKGMFEAWDRQGAIGRIDGMIHRMDRSLSGRLKDWRERLARAFSRSAWLNDATPLESAVVRLMAERGISPASLPPDRNPAVLRAAMLMNAKGTARHFIFDGAVDYDFNRVGPSLGDVLQGVKDDLRSWVNYAVARRAQHLHTRGINPGISREDADYVVETLGNADFEWALAQWTRWSDHLLDYVVASGGLTPEAAQAMREANPIWVPFQRYFDETYLGGSGGGSGRRGVVNQGKSVKSIKGSGRRIVDPLDTIIQHAEAMIRLGNKLQIARAVVDLVESGQGGAWFAEKVEPPKTFMTDTVGGLRQQLEEAGADLSDADLEKVLFVVDNAVRYFGKDNIVTIWRDGKREFWEVDPEVYRVLTEMDAESIGPIVKFLAPPARLMRLGATGLNVGFSMVTNPLRDAATFAAYTKGSPNPLAPIGGLIAHATGSPEAKLWKAMGGQMATIMGQDRMAGRRFLNEALAKTPGEKVLTATHPVIALDHLRDAFGAYEAGPRVAEFRRVLKQAEERWGKGSRAARIEAMLASKDVTINFTRAGTIARVINQVTPFWNAKMQGISRFGRAFTGTPAYGALGGGNAARATKMILARGIAGLTIPSLVLWMLHRDDEWYRELSRHERMAFWHARPFDDGPIIRIPKPLDIGYAFGSLPVETIDGLYRQDAHSGQDIVDAVFDTTNQYLPIPLLERGGLLGVIDPTAGAEAWPQAVSLPAELMFNYDLFRRRPIVPTHERESRPIAAQYGKHTTETAKMLGRALNVSPRLVEHAMRGSTGGLGLDIARWVETMLGIRQPDRAREAADLPVVGRLFAREPSGESTRTVQRLYDEYERLKRTGGSESASIEDQARARMVERAVRRLSEIRKAREADLIPSQLADQLIVRTALEGIGAVKR